MSINTAQKEELIREETRETEDGVYTYTLLAKTGISVASYGLTLYSVIIQMTDSSGHRTEARLDDIFSDSDKAYKFFNKLIKNLATPIDLPYILEDELC